MAKFNFPILDYPDYKLPLYTGSKPFETNKIKLKLFRIYSWLMQHESYKQKGFYEHLKYIKVYFRYREEV